MCAISVSNALYRELGAVTSYISCITVYAIKGFVKVWSRFFLFVSNSSKEGVLCIGIVHSQFRSAEIGRSHVGSERSYFVVLQVFPGSRWIPRLWLSFCPLSSLSNPKVARLGRGLNYPSIDSHVLVVDSFQHFCLFSPLL